MTIHDLAAACGAPEKPIDKVLACMLRKLKTDSDLMDELIGGLIRTACLDAVYAKRHKYRYQMKYGTPWTENDEMMDLKGMLYASAILNTWQLEHAGVLLGDATADILNREIEYERSLSNGHLRNARFYASLVKRVGNKSVREVVSESKAKELLQSAAA